MMMMMMMMMIPVLILTNISINTNTITANQVTFLASRIILGSFPVGVGANNSSYTSRVRIVGAMAVVVVLVVVLICSRSDSGSIGSSSNDRAVRIDMIPVEPLLD